MSNSPVLKTPSDRLLSIDALRGFDMFWIIGGEVLAKKSTEWLAGPAANWLQNRFDSAQWVQTWSQWSATVAKVCNEQMEHVDWEGFHFYDLIFPLFLFVVGVVLPFSLGKLQERGVQRSSLYWRIFRRTLLLFVLGLIYYRILEFDWQHQRYVGVLQRIAICYGVAAVIVLNTKAPGQVAIVAAILLGYWALLALTPSPESHLAGDYSKEANLAGYVDRHFLPGEIKHAYYKYGDNEGYLSTIPAVATALLGALAGSWLRTNWSPGVKVLGLLVAGGSCLALGTFWAQSFPVIKILWTSSYVLVAGGYSVLLLALFYGIIDGLKFRRWSYFFVVIGANAITIYVLERVIDFNQVAMFFFGGLGKHVGAFEPVLLIAGMIAIEWVLLWFLYRNRLFLRV